ncbi:MAG TPA: SET domain-containing protein [Solimonas sp.]|nr:SET domain-containing protein [Solimonas sp.]
MIRYQASTGRGLGVFAGRRFEAGELIERVPVIVIPEEQRPLLAETLLDAYDFDWDAGGRQTAIVLGYGSLYNHSVTPNARYTRLFDSQEMLFTALRRIEPDEEILIHYNGDSDDPRRIVFDGALWWREG